MVVVRIKLFDDVSHIVEIDGLCEMLIRLRKEYLKLTEGSFRHLNME